ncbi:hypothetical protein MAR_017824 [Mya arenaria]|uniref:Uncharacterized protein n=1 Tax=Mya arenaria TaxID=6604 RepID=A0ABY7EGE1_MYAAR|nr:hypothetical protein MAR_017824 [Mya arenaria]
MDGQNKDSMGYNENLHLELNDRDRNVIRTVRRDTTIVPPSSPLMRRAAVSSVPVVRGECGDMWGHVIYIYLSICLRDYTACTCKMLLPYLVTVNLTCATTQEHAHNTLMDSGIQSPHSNWCMSLSDRDWMSRDQQMNSLTAADVEHVSSYIKRQDSLTDSETQSGQLKRISEDAVYCVHCVVFRRANKRRGQLASEPFRNGILALEVFTGHFTDAKRNQKDRKNVHQAHMYSKVRAELFIASMSKKMTVVKHVDTTLKAREGGKVEVLQPTVCS